VEGAQTTDLKNVIFVENNLKAKDTLTSSYTLNCAEHFVMMSAYNIQYSDAANYAAAQKHKTKQITYYLGRCYTINPTCYYGVKLRRCKTYKKIWIVRDNSTRSTRLISYISVAHITLLTSRSGRRHLKRTRIELFMNTLVWWVSSCVSQAEMKVFLLKVTCRSLHIVDIERPYRQMQVTTQHIKSSTFNKL